MPDIPAVRPASLTLPMTARLNLPTRDNTDGLVPGGQALPDLPEIAKRLRCWQLALDFVRAEPESGSTER